MIRLGLIGDGRIARALLAALAGDGRVAIVARLVRTPGRPGTTVDVEAVLAARPDLVIEVAGAAALALHGPRLLSACDVWTVSAAALVDPDTAARIAAAERRDRHRLRILPGAIGGLDAVAALTRAGAGRLVVAVTRPGLLGGAGRRELPLSEAVRHHPDELNVAAAAALRGPGPARTDVVLVDPGPDGAHRIGLRIEAPSGCFEAAYEIAPLGGDRLHPVAASVLAALDERLTRPPP